jgi:hypothetical protein
VVIRPGCEADHTLPSSVEVKNTQRQIYPYFLRILVIVIIKIAITILIIEMIENKITITGLKNFRAYRNAGMHILEYVFRTSS